jgi:hypothetical protein
LKYKCCCLRREDDVALDARGAEWVWDRMQSWALDRFKDELYGLLEEHMAISPSTARPRMVRA